ncbi:MAG: malonic semialdehyde reductase [Aeromicrobium sp.]
MTSLALDSRLTLSNEAQNLLFREARTANSFTDEPVSTEQIEAIYELVKFGPTAMNNQPLRVVLIQSGDARARLLPLLSEGNRAKTEAAPLVAVLAADTDFHDKLPEHFPHFPGARDMFVDNDEHRIGQASFNAALQIGYLIIGIRAAGLAAGPMGGFDRDGVDKEFFAGTGLKSQLVVNIGHPGEDAWFDRLPRLASDEAILVA